MAVHNHHEQTAGCVVRFKDIAKVRWQKVQVLRGVLKVYPKTEAEKNTVCDSCTASNVNATLSWKHLECITIICSARQRSLQSNYAICWNEYDCTLFSSEHNVDVLLVSFSLSWLWHGYIAPVVSGDIVVHRLPAFSTLLLMTTRVTSKVFF